MDTRIVSAQQLVDDEVRWRDLAANALEPNPALDPDLLGPALTLTHAPADLRFVVVEADGRLEACLPIRPIDRWLRFRRRAFTTRLDGAPVPVLPILAAPLVRAEQGEEAVHAVLASLVAETAQAAIGLLVLERLDEGPVAALISDACRTLRLPTYSYEHWERPVLRRRDDTNDWWAGISPQRLRDLGKKRRRLERAAGEVRILDRGDDGAAIDDLLAMQASGWKAAAGTAMVSDPAKTAFLRESSARLATASRLHLITLDADGTPAAMCLAVECGSRLFLLHLDFDPKFAQFSPGAQLEAALSEFFHASTTADVMDPVCAPSNAFHAHFLPDRLGVSSFALAIGGVPDRALVRAAPYLFEARHPIRAVKQRGRRVARDRRPGSPMASRPLRS
jgi:CelD/BcsL family acetyltransferase involved in cellulose biosynthesis